MDLDRLKPHFLAGERESHGFYVTSSAMRSQLLYALIRTQPRRGDKFSAKSSVKLQFYLTNRRRITPNFPGREIITQLVPEQSFITTCVGHYETFILVN